MNNRNVCLFFVQSCIHSHVEIIPLLFFGCVFQGDTVFRCYKQVGCFPQKAAGKKRKKKNPNQYPTLSTPKQMNNQSPALPPTLCSDPVLIQRGSSRINGQKCTYNGPISHTPPPRQRTPAEIEDATAQNCLVLLTLCKAASIYAATGSHQRRLNSGL